MDKKFLYSMVAVLALANATVYIQKTNPSFFSKILPNSSEKTDSWINQDFPKSDTAPVVPPKVNPVPPKTEPVPPRNQPKVQPQEPQRRQPFRRSDDNCPRCQPG